MEYAICVESECSSCGSVTKVNQLLDINKKGDTFKFRLPSVCKGCGSASGGRMLGFKQVTAEIVYKDPNAEEEPSRGDIS